MGGAVPAGHSGGPARAAIRPVAPRLAEAEDRSAVLVQVSRIRVGIDERSARGKHPDRPAVLRSPAHQRDGFDFAEFTVERPAGCPEGRVAGRHGREGEGGEDRSDDRGAPPAETHRAARACRRLERLARRGERPVVDDLDLLFGHAWGVYGAQVGRDFDRAGNPAAARAGSGRHRGAALAACPPPRVSSASAPIAGGLRIRPGRPGSELEAVAGRLRVS